jgi:hypothetical protein
MPSFSRLYLGKVSPTLSIVLSLANLLQKHFTYPANCNCHCQTKESRLFLEKDYHQFNFCAEIILPLKGEVSRRDGGVCLWLDMNYIRCNALCLAGRRRGLLMAGGDVCNAKRTFPFTASVYKNISYLTFNLCAGYIFDCGKNPPLLMGRCPARGGTEGFVVYSIPF